jgi:hypothetical protein
MRDSKAGDAVIHSPFEEYKTYVVGFGGAAMSG